MNAITLVLQMDFHKNIQIPNLSSQYAYYKKRLTTQLFGIFHANHTMMQVYAYPSTVGGEGPDEVISFLDRFLKRNQTAGFRHLVLCPTQFKDNYLFFYCKIVF